jgi:transposase-like protein
MICVDLVSKNWTTVSGNVAVCRQEVDMPKQYAPEFRRRVCERLMNGETVKSLVAELHVSEHTLYTWRKQALIDVGQRPGVKSGEFDALKDARRRIRELEDELKMTRAASELFAEGQANPKSRTRW